MAVLKNKTQGRYVIIGMSPMQDRSLGIKERGLLFTIMSLPDNWEFSIAGLAKILPDGRESLGRVVQSLEDKGYLTRNQSRSDGGAFGGNVIEVHEVPVIGQNPSTENPAAAFCPENGQKPATENPLTGNPATDFPTQYNTNISNTTGILVSINPSRQAEYERIRAEVMERISYEALIHDHPDAMDTIDLITEILITVEGTEQKSLRVGKEEKPIGVVRSQFRKLTMFHIQYVLGSLANAGKIVNPTAYLLTSLYRSVFTMEMHMGNHAMNDMREWQDGGE